MAKSKNNPEQTTVTRVKASDTKTVAKKQLKVARPKKTTTDSDTAKKNIVKRFFSYFKDAWFELKQVRWPNRRATWGMTAALLTFTALFVAFIVVVDLLWENLFKLILR